MEQQQRLNQCSSNNHHTYRNHPKHGSNGNHNISDRYSIANSRDPVSGVVCCLCRVCMYVSGPCICDGRTAVYVNLRHGASVLLKGRP